MTQDPQAGELRRALAPLMDRVMHAVARLVLHITGASPLDDALVRHYTKVLKAFMEAVDAAP